MLKNCFKKEKSDYQKESINCFIEDDTEEHNHYESYMKFRKKILERELESEMINILKQEKFNKSHA